jgi:hypothetical protein
MQAVKAAAICIAVLYGLDAIFFDGRYLTVADHVCSEFYTHWLAAHWSRSF